MQVSSFGGHGDGGLTTAARSFRAPRPGFVLRTPQPCPNLEVFAALVVREGPSQASQRPRLSEKVRQLLRARHYSPRTEKAYLGWMR
ncbi:MAG: hypothetical protein AB1486_23905, partial [Planctomycetota bacterium]